MNYWLLKGMFHLYSVLPNVCFNLVLIASPMKLLRQFPPLNSKTIISVAVSLVRKIPEELFEALVDHAR